jgi:RND family efflux transporter MFP subunit
MQRTLEILIVVATIGAAVACNRAGHTPAARAAAALAVDTASVVVTDVPDRLEAGGVVLAPETALLSSRIMAAVASVRVRAGDRVRRGDVLVTLDGRDLADQARRAHAAASAAEKSVLQARSEETAAAAEHRLSMQWHARITALHARSSATAQERDEAEARLAAATARLAGAQASIERAAADLDAARAAAGGASTTASFASIHAPFDGLVTERLIDPGNLASPGTPLVRLDAAGTRQVAARVDEARVRFIQVGQAVDVLTEGTDTTSGAEAVVGTVVEIARTVDVDQRAFTVKVSLPAGEQARTGTFARLRFNGPSRPVLVIPLNAVRRHGQVTTVFVAQDGLARLRLIQAGERWAGGLVALAGLDAGETVITAAPAELFDGAPIAARRVDSTGVRP